MSLERTHRKPDDIERELSFEPADITGFRPSEPLETIITPVHGDYLPGNLLVTDGRVSGVIDWEYGALEGSPAVDAGLLVLDVVNQVAGGLAPGLNRLVDGGPLADQVGRPLATYCDTLEIPSRSLVTDLPLAYVHRLELDWQVGTTSTASSRVERRARAVELVAERRPDLERWLESYR
ncbi:MAG: phosphotransferase [Natrialbaceae archaeon]|nr:phosphotransferase [Natrialbaceae archaeon]